MQVYTISMSQWRVAKKANIPLIDITVKSGKSAFAPTWDLLARYKDNFINDDGYISEYKDLLKQRWFRNNSVLKEETMDLISKDGPIALACFCPAGAFCHRHLVVDFLQWRCQQYGILFEYMGELE